MQEAPVHLADCSALPCLHVLLTAHTWPTNYPPTAAVRAAQRESWLRPHLRMCHSCSARLFVVLRAQLPRSIYPHAKGLHSPIVSWADGINSTMHVQAVKQQAANAGGCAMTLSGMSSKCMWRICLV